MQICVCAPILVHSYNNEVGCFGAVGGGVGLVAEVDDVQMAFGDGFREVVGLVEVHKQLVAGAGGLHPRLAVIVFHGAYIEYAAFVEHCRSVVYQVYCFFF